MKQRKIKLLRQSQDLDLHELPKFSYSRKRREERGGGERKRRRRYWPFLRCVLARGAFEKLAPVYPSVFPGRWLDELRGWLLRNSLSLVSPWQIFNSTATWKNRILPMLAATRTGHPSSRRGDVCVGPRGRLDTHAPGKSYFDQEANLMYFIDFTLRAMERGESEWHTLLSLLSL